jgi:predicted ATPase
MIYLREINLRNIEKYRGFPFNLPIFQSWQTLELSSEVTFFMGENGSGKSTLLETIACAVGSITIGSESVKTDPTLADIRQLAKSMKLSWNTKTHRGFFLRAEDFFGFIKQLSRTKVQLEKELRDVDETYQDRSAFARIQAKTPYVNELSDLTNRYGDGLHVHSHGESYLEFFQERFVPGGLYLLDEPESALSPLRQLGLISLLREMIRKKAQFIISTHSPIISAFPQAEIFSFDRVPIEPSSWSSLEHVALTRDFLNDPNDFLRHL